MATPISNKTIVTQAADPKPDSKSNVTTKNPLIHARDIVGYIKEYEIRCKRSPQLRGRSSEIAILKNIIDRYVDTNEVLIDKDAEIVIYLCQCNADNRPPRNKEKMNDWLFRQIATDYNFPIIENSNYFDMEQFFCGDK